MRGGGGLTRRVQPPSPESGLPRSEGQLLELYVRACEQRRALRLQTVLRQAPRIVFTKHRTIRPSFFAYTEGQSDAQNERHFRPGAALCLLETGRSPRPGAHAARGSQRRHPRSRPSPGMRRGCCSPGRSRWTRTTTISTSSNWPPAASGRSPPGWASPITSRPICPTATSSSPRRAACRRWIAGGRK